MEEGRYRVLYTCVSLAFALCACYLYSHELLFLCVKPILSLDKSFIFTEVAEAFYVTLKVCALWGLASTLPLSLYQGWCFASPSCFPAERARWGAISLICGSLSLLAIGGTYVLLLPKAVSILLSFEILDPVLSIQLEARVGPYIDLSLRAALLAIAALQLPLGFSVCFYLRLFNPRLLTNNRKPFLLASLLLAALVSPPDVSAQCGLALLFSLYWEGVALLGFVILQLTPAHTHW